MKSTHLLSLSLLLSSAVFASEWTGKNANWDSDANPGWNGTGVPNAIGAYAVFGDATASATIAQNVSADGVRLGALIVSGSKSGDIAINKYSGFSGTPTNLVFNMDGAGPGYAVVSNTGPRRLSLGTGYCILEDDLEIVNAPENPNAGNSYAIGGNGALHGTGKVTFDNNQNTYNQRIGLGNSGTYVGDTLIRRGAVGYTSNGSTSSFGKDPKTGGNRVTLGETGMGDASLILDGTAAVFYHTLETASDVGGILRLASNYQAGKKWTATVGGNVTLNDGLVLSIPAPDAGYTGVLLLSGIVSGNGGLAKEDTGTATLSKANTYAGGTAVSAGCLAVASSGSLGTGPVSVAAGATLSLSNSVAIADAADVTLGAGSDAYGVLDLPAGVHESVGTLHLGSRWKLKGTYGATGSGAKYIDDRHFTGGGVLEVLTGPPEGTVLLVY